MVGTVPRTEPYPGLGSFVPLELLPGSIDEALSLVAVHYYLGSGIKVRSITLGDNIKAVRSCWKKEIKHRHVTLQHERVYTAKIIGQQLITKGWGK